MASKRGPKRCLEWEKRPPFGQCLRLEDHDDDCRFQPATLSPREEAVWLSALGATGDLAIADDRVDILRRHLADDSPSKLKDPAYRRPPFNPVVRVNTPPIEDPNA